MRHFLLFLFAILLIASVNPPSDVEAQTCTHWASATGSGSGNCTQGTPCTITRAWVVLAAAGAPGKTLCLTNGHYTAVDANDSIISIPTNISGSTGNPLTIRAENDGLADIDGGGNIQPIWIPSSNSNYITFIGLNAHDSKWSVISTGAANHDFIFRRVVAWNAGPGDTTVGAWSIFEMNYAYNILIEDSAGFGTGGSGIQLFGTYTQPKATVRRYWGMYGGSTYENAPNEVIHMGYTSTKNTIENVIVTWRPNVSSPEGDRALIIMGVNGQELKLLGSIGYFATNTNLTYGLLEWFSDLYESPPFSALIQDNVMYFPGNSTTIPFGILDFLSGTDCGTTGMPTCYFRRNTEIAGGNSNYSGIGPGNWTSTNNVDAATVAALGSTNSIWNGTSGNGARVCYRYVDGTLTTTKLWPWPMDDRIKAALQYAYGTIPAAGILGGVLGPGYAANTVTSQMVALFGAIPAECISSGVTVTVNITSPTSNPTWPTSSPTISLGGTSSLP